MSSTWSGPRPRAVTLVAVVVAALGAAVTAGVAAAWAVWAGRPDDSADQWSDLGHGIAALLVGCVAALLVYVAGIVMGVCWTVPRGRRLAMAVALLAGPVGVAVAAGSVMTQTALGGRLPISTAVALVLLAAAGSGIGVATGAVDRRTGAWVVGGAVAVAGALLVGLGGW
jgi:hypothetical protein